MLCPKGNYHLEWGLLVSQPATARTEEHPSRSTTKALLTHSSLWDAPADLHSPFLSVLLLANPVHSKYLYVGAWHSCFNFFLDLSPPFRPGLFCWCASGNYELPEWLTRVPAKPSPGLFSPWGMFVLATPVRALELGISVHTPHLQAALVTCMNVGADVSNNMYPMYLFETYHFQETQFRHPKPT